MKDLKPNKHVSFEEILFENRNKQYGAYALRKESDAVLTKALFVGLGLLATVVITPFIVNSFKDKPIVHDIPEGYFPPISVEDWDKPVDPVEPVVLPKVKTDFKQVDTRTPEPTKEVKGEEKGAATLAERQDAVQGTSDQAGDKPQVEIVIPTQTRTDGGTVGENKTTPKTEPVDLNKINTSVDVQATFKGGIDAFRNEVVKRFPVDDFADEGGAVRATINFVVERDGTISQITASGPNAIFNAEAVKTVKKIKGVWEPAKIKGTAVRSYFKFPMVMNFE